MDAYSQYQKQNKQSLQDLKLEELLVKLHEGILLKLDSAEQNFKLDREHKAKECIFQSIKIINGLTDNLDSENGGETADNLEKLYVFCLTELSKAIKSNEYISHFNNVKQIIVVLKKSWNDLSQAA